MTARIYHIGYEYFACAIKETINVSTFITLFTANSTILYIYFAIALLASQRRVAKDVEMETPWTSVGDK